jgi:cold shock CspA family protein
MTGKINSFWQHKHFGFIVQDDALEELFFHEKNLTLDSPPPQKGLRVTYEVGKYNGRPVAVNVRVVLPSLQSLLGGAA